MKKLMIVGVGVALTILSVTSAQGDVPLQVQDVTYVQDKRTQRVEVDYTLVSDEPALVRLDILTNGVSIGMEKIKTLSGDVSRNFSTFIAPGRRHLSWSARSDWSGHLEPNAVAVVYAWPAGEFYAVPGSYMVVDISGGASAATYPVSFTFDDPNPEENANLSTKLWLKCCPPGTYQMGSPTTEIGRTDNEDLHQVTLTQPFFAGVFNVTRAQYKKVVGSEPPNQTGEDDYCPVTQVSWNMIRGVGCVWPASNDVATASFMGLLRAKTGIDGFDLPTEAQWECAARARETAAYNNGFFLTEPCPYDTGRHEGPAHPEIVEIAWCRPESNGKVRPIRVGTKKPNNWGLYDMSGNVYDWCLDWYQRRLGTAPVTDPVGPASGSYIVARSCGAGGTCGAARTAFRLEHTRHTKDKQDGGYGFRVFCTAR